LQSKQRIDQRKSEKRLRIYGDKQMRKKEKPITGFFLDLYTLERKASELV